MENLHGVQAYVSNPKNVPSGKVNTIIMIPDIFGIYVNAKLLCDEWAGQGYKVLMPDLFEGDAVPVDMLNVSFPPPYLTLLRERSDDGLTVKT